MRVYLKSRTGKYDATGDYNFTTRELVILKGSRVSSTISQGSFRSAKTVEKFRNSKDVLDGILINNISFKSASTAANFITGTSTNGLKAWKNEDGVALYNLQNGD